MVGAATIRPESIEMVTINYEELNEASLVSYLAAQSYVKYREPR